MTPGEQLMARLGLDTSGFKAGLKDAHSAFRDLTKAVGVGLSVAGIGEAGRRLIEYGKNVFDLSRRFGVATDVIQKFGNAAAENGSSMEGMTRGINKLEVAISRALGGNASLLQNFANLGITVEDLKKLSPDELMLKIGKSSMNAADMVKVFGKSALELRPVLAGLADGSIQLGDAIDAGMIKKLKEADETFVRIGRSLRINIANELSFIIDGMKKMFSGLSDAAVAEFRGIAAAAKLNFTEAARQAELMKKALGEAREGAFGRNEKPEKEEGASPRRFENTGEGVAKKSKAELDAEKKERERDQLSLKDLAEKGPHSAYNQGDYYVQSNGTAQMIYAAQQARLVEQLEAQARQVRLSGVSATGETSAGLLSRADAIRQTLPIKETEKEVGIYRQAFKDALSETNQLLTEVRDELE